jgi:hypothetical protein
MYAEISQRPPPPRPFSQPPAFSCTPALCAASCERFSDCPPLLSAHFLTPTTGTCQAPQATPVERGAAPVIPMVTVRIPPSSMGKTRVVVQVAMSCWMIPRPGKPIMRLPITHYPPRSTASAASTRHRHDQPHPRPRRGRFLPRPIRQRRAGRRRVPATTTISVPPISVCR